MSESHATLSADEIMRYARHLALPEFGVEGQTRLRASSVLVVGAGGLGCAAAMYLAAAGVGTIGVMDHDVVDASNLHRQVLYGLTDVGHPKVHVMREQLIRINPLVNVRAYPFRLDVDNALQTFENFDLIIDATDNYATRYLVNDAAALVHKPYVWGSLFRFEGMVSVFHQEAGPCYRCLFPEAPPEGLFPNCAEGGVLGTLCGVIGALQATEAIKVLTSIGKPLVGRISRLDVLLGEWQTLSVASDPGCALCGVRPTVAGLQSSESYAACAVSERSSAEDATRITATQLQELLNELHAGKRKFRLIDVREPYEFVTGSIEGAENRPIRGFETGEALSDLDESEEIVLYCMSGQRSSAARGLLEQEGFGRVVDLDGGFLSWLSAEKTTSASNS